MWSAQTFGSVVMFVQGAVYLLQFVGPNQQVRVVQLLDDEPVVGRHHLFVHRQQHLQQRRIAELLRCPGSVGTPDLLGPKPACARRGRLEGGVLLRGGGLGGPADGAPVHGALITSGAENKLGLPLWRTCKRDS